MGSTILRALGKPEWVVHSEEEYVATVASLAQDVDGRAALRAGQRSLMARSPLCDARALTQSLQEAFEAMLVDWAARSAESYKRERNEK
jgi:predicted O-linked N-acetylglucosamine transferase (SPINDLY family)